MKAVARVLTDKDNSSLVSRYHTVIEEIASLVRSAGYELNGFRPDLKTRFTTFEPVKQKSIVEGLEAFLGLCLSAVNDGAELKGDSQPAAWWVISRLGWRPRSDVFSHISQGDTIEIYDVGHVQIFRSFNMFRCISYSLDELVTHEWFELYSRPPGEQEKVMDRFQAAIRERRTIVEGYSDSHVVSEVFSPRRRSAYYQTKLVSPLFSSSNEVAGYMNVIRATPIDN